MACASVNVYERLYEKFRKINEIFRTWLVPRSQGVLLRRRHSVTAESAYDPRMRYLCGALLLIAFAVHADDVSESRRLQTMAAEARRQNDLPLFLEKITAASALRPQHAGLLYQLAIAQALNGRSEDAKATLERIAAMGFGFAPAKELAALPVAEIFRRNELPVGKPAVALTLNAAEPLIEGIAHYGGRIFLSSVRTRQIFDGNGRVFADKLPWGVFGMAVDAKRGLLWAATAAVPQMAGFTPADEGKAAVVKLDLRTGRVLATFPMEKALFGDLAVARNGDVYVSDSTNPVIYKVEGERLVPFVRGPFSSLQGLAITNRTLYAADYSQGLFAIDTVTRDIHKLAVPRNTSLLGIDGLYLAAPNTLVATQNGTSPARVVRIVLDSLRVKSVDVLTANDPRMTDLTLGTIRGKEFLFIANAQWSAWDEQGALRPETQLAPVTVLRVGY
jgi:hypothetical protein